MGFVKDMVDKLGNAAGLGLGADAGARLGDMITEDEKARRVAASGLLGLKKGGTASSRADGIAQRGKTRGTIAMCGGGYTKGKK